MLDDFFVRALVAGIGLAVVTGPVGCFIVWRRLAYFGETIAHSSLLGVAVAILSDVNLTLGIFFTATVVVFIVFLLERREGLPTDTILGLLAHGGLALGLVLLSFFPGVRIDLHALLFGDILAVSRHDLLVIWVGGAIVLGLLCCLWTPLLLTTISNDLSTVESRKPLMSKLLFGVLVAAVIAVAVKIVGVLLIVALLIIPAATARRFANIPETMAIGAALVGVVSVAGGLFASLQFDTPSGPSIVVAALVCFVLARIPIGFLKGTKQTTQT